MTTMDTQEATNGQAQTGQGFSIVTDNRIAGCVAPDNSRYAIGAPWVVIQGGSGVIAATDGRTAAVRPVTVDRGSADGEYRTFAGALGKTATKYAKRFRVRSDGGAQVQADELDRKDGVKLTKTGEPNDQNTTPPVAEVMPNPGLRDHASITVNPDLLYAAMKAAQSDGDEHGGVVSIRVEYREDGEYSMRPIVCIGHGPDGGASVCMPVKRGASPRADHDRAVEMFNRTSTE